MKYLSRNIIKEIESHFYNWSRERKELERLANNVEENAAEQAAEGFFHGFGSRAAKMDRAEIERRVQDLQRWVDLVETVRSKLAGTPQLSFITMIYVEKLCEVQVCEKLFIERRTFYNWKSDVLGYAAMKACEMGLISV